MIDKKDLDFDNVVMKLRQDPEYRKEERRLRPYTDLVVQIVTRRDELGLTQKDLAVRANTHQSRISKIESGEHDIRLSTLIDVAEALGCEINIQLVPFQEATLETEGQYTSLFSAPVNAEWERAPFIQISAGV